MTSEHLALADRVEAAEFQSCPFDSRLARTPYLVLPKLALQAMPVEWRVRFDAMLQEMEDAGLETPDYLVVPEGGEIRQRICRDRDSWQYGERVGQPSISDPWADYRYGKVHELCPDFDRSHASRVGDGRVGDQQHQQETGEGS